MSSGGETTERAAPGFQAVQRYAGQVMGWAVGSTTTVTRFEHGNRHAVYRVINDGDAVIHQDVVVRVVLGADAVDRAQADREASVLDTLQGIAGPMLHDFQASSPWFDTPVMCLEFLPGRQLDLDSRSPDEVSLVGSLVATVHNQSTNDLTGELWGQPSGVYRYAQDRIQSILGSLAWSRAPLPEEQQERLEHAAERAVERFGSLTAAAGFDPNEPLHLLHGDIGPGNVLWDPSPRLIDWEYTRLGDPADEVAYTFDQNLLTEVQQEAFWFGYRQTIDPRLNADRIQDRIHWWLPVTILGSALWWAERFVRRSELDTAGLSDPAVSRKPAYYLQHITARLDRLQGLPDEPR